MTGKKQIALLISAIALRRPINFHKTFSSIILLPNAAPEVVAGFMWISMRACGAAENIQARKGNEERLALWRGTTRWRTSATAPCCAPAWGAVARENLRDRF